MPRTGSNIVFVEKTCRAETAWLLIYADRLSGRADRTREWDEEINPWKGTMWCSAPGILERRERSRASARKIECASRRTGDLTARGEVEGDADACRGGGVGGESCVAGIQRDVALHTTLQAPLPYSMTLPPVSLWSSKS